MYIPKAMNKQIEATNRTFVANFIPLLVYGVRKNISSVLYQKRINFGHSTAIEINNILPRLVLVKKITPADAPILKSFEIDLQKTIIVSKIATRRIIKNAMIRKSTQRNDTLFTLRFRIPVTGKRPNNCAIKKTVETTF